MRISDGSSDVFSSDLIDLHDPPFAPDRLDQEGEPHFGHLAGVTRPAAALPQEDILRGLLADGRSAAQLLALGVTLDRLFDRQTGRASCRERVFSKGRSWRSPDP